MVLLNDLISAHILVGGARDRCIVDVLRSLAVDRVAGHDLLHSLELLHVARGLLWRQVVACLAVSRVCINYHGSLAPLRAHRHICRLLVQVGHHVVLIEELLRLLDDDTRAAQLLIQDIFVIEEAVIGYARRGRTLSR